MPSLWGTNPETFGWFPPCLPIVHYPFTFPSFQRFLIPSVPSDEQFYVLKVENPLKLNFKRESMHSMNSESRGNLFW